MATTKEKAAAPAAPAAPAKATATVAEVFAKRAHPLQRASDLTAEQRRALERLVAEKQDGSRLWTLGLPRFTPDRPDDLRRFLGQLPACAVDVMVDVAGKPGKPGKSGKSGKPGKPGKPTPLWTLIGDTLQAFSPSEAKIGALINPIFEQLKPAQRKAAWKLLVSQDPYALTWPVFHDDAQEERRRPLGARFTQRLAQSAYIDLLAAWAERDGMDVSLDSLAPFRGPRERCFAAAVLMTRDLAKDVRNDALLAAFFEAPFDDREPFDLALKFLWQWPVDRAGPLMPKQPKPVEALLAKLPLDWAHRLRVGLAYADNLGQLESSVEHCGLAHPTNVGDRPVLLAKDLTPHQRVVAEILTVGTPIRLLRAKMPRELWVRRQWLGLDPPGLLFSIEVQGRPFWNAIMDTRGDKAAGAKLLAAVPKGQRTALLCELLQDDQDYFSDAPEKALRGPLPSLGKKGGEWAKAYLDAMVAGAPGHASRPAINVALFDALLDAKLPIAPEWDVFLPLGERFLDAVPEGRRTAAILRGLPRTAFDGPRMTLALERMARYPSPELAIYLLTDIKKANDTSKVLKVVESAAKKDAAIAAAAAPFLADILKAPKLTVAKTLEPITLKALDDAQKKQLAHANKLYGGKKLTAAELVAQGDGAEETISPSMTAYMRIDDDKKKHVYDYWYYNGDSGCFFKAGTTTVVAEVVQDGLECANLKLSLALQAVRKKVGK